MGQLLDELTPPARADGFYGDWCSICGLDDFCASVARDVQGVAGGGGAELRYVALANAVGQDGMGGKYVHGSRHWISVVYSVRRRADARRLYRR